jgi:hypothetical protein
MRGQPGVINLPRRKKESSDGKQGGRVDDQVHDNLLESSRQSHAQGQSHTQNSEQQRHYSQPQAQYGQLQAQYSQPPAQHTNQYSDQYSQQAPSYHQVLGRQQLTAREGTEFDAAANLVKQAFHKVRLYALQMQLTNASRTFCI